MKLLEGLSLKDRLALKDQIIDAGIAAGASAEEIEAAIFGPRVARPCPKCGKETKRHQGPDGEDPKNPIRICSNRKCRIVIKG